MEDLYGILSEESLQPKKYPTAKLADVDLELTSNIFEASQLFDKEIEYETELNQIRFKKAFLLRRFHDIQYLKSQGFKTFKEFAEYCFPHVDYHQLHEICQTGNLLEMKNGKVMSFATMLRPVEYTDSFGNVLIKEYDYAKLHQMRSLDPVEFFKMHEQKTITPFMSLKEIKRVMKERCK
ncbi:MAG: hypothetical protein IKN55_01190 [Oscillospiraceae bacterium]|nr:hypothetical protein [Oscillospiraceae bacterium]